MSSHRCTSWLIVALCLCLGAVFVYQTGVGPHVCLPAFAAAHAWARQTVFWRYAVPVLLAYSAASAWLMHGGWELLPHVTAGLVAYLLTTLIPDRRPRPEGPEEQGGILGLDR